MLFRSLLIGSCLASFLVSATPLPDFSPHEAELYDREFMEILARAIHFPKHGTYSKSEAVNFVKNIPDHKLANGGGRDRQGTIHTADAKGKTNVDRPKDGHRLDYQGKTSDGRHNLQVQINGESGKEKTSVGGVITDGGWGPKRLKKELAHSIMHPAKDKEGNEYFRTQKSGKAPAHPDGKSKTNAEARKSGGPRTPKPKSPLSKSNRKAGRKSLGKK